MKIVKNLTIVALMLMLVGCGGGAGSAGSNGSNSLPPPPPPIQEVTVPNSLIPTGGTGTKDTFYMANCQPTTERCYTEVGTNNLINIVNTAGNTVYPSGVTLGHRRIQGSTRDDPSLQIPSPPRDVRQAWRDGWTGRGVDVLILDGFGLPSSPPGDADTHGYTVALSLREIAPRANLHGANVGSRGSIAEGNYLQGGLLFGSNRRMEVVNMSFGSESLGRRPTSNEINSYRSSALFADLRGRGRFSTNLADAVLVKAAGNENGADASFSDDKVALVADSYTGPRTLIVGALDKYARTRNSQNQSNTSTGATIARYSNRAGATNLIQRQFLVEYGGSPYRERALLCDSGTPASRGCANGQTLDVDTQGTSFATPRVSGFAALVRDKFPGLSGGQTVKILLDTATTQGLACHRSGQKDHRNCRIDIYGQGRVDIGSALSPIGKLN